MSRINQNRWDCTSCGVNQGPNDMWFEGDECGVCHDQHEAELDELKQDEEDKKEMNTMLITIYDRIGIDEPSNHDQILQYVFDDVRETADPVDWHDGDVAIAFRRWIEAQAKEVD